MTRTASPQRTGRGGLAILGAKLFFLVTGFLQQILLPRVLGLAGYGALSRVLAFGNVLTNVVVASCLQGVSRSVASTPGTERQTLRAALRVHGPLACVLGLAFALAAPAFAWFEKTPAIRLPLVAMGGVVFLYGLYAPLVGLLNGTQCFSRQAALDTTFSVFRTVGMLGGGWMFVQCRLSGPLGATLGFVLAVLLILPLAVRSAGLFQATARHASTPFVPRAYGALLLSLGATHLCTYALMQADLLLVGRFLSQQALHLHPGDPVVASTAADEWVAVYRACQLFAFLPYQLLMSLTQVLFPLLAAAKAQGDFKAVQLYIQRGARLGALVAGLMVALIAGLAHPLLEMTYGPHVADCGASVLRLLALGQGAFTLMGIAMTILTSLGKERLSALLGGTALCFLVVNCTLCVPHATFGQPQLQAAALATLVSLGISLLCSSLFLVRAVGSFLPFWSAIRITISVLCTLWLATKLPPCSVVSLPLWGAVLTGAFLSILVLLRELSAADAHGLRSLLPKSSL